MYLTLPGPEKNSKPKGRMAQGEVREPERIGARRGTKQRTGLPLGKLVLIVREGVSGWQRKQDYCDTFGRRLQRVRTPMRDGDVNDECHPNNTYFCYPM